MSVIKRVTSVMRKSNIIAFDRCASKLPLRNYSNNKIMHASALSFRDVFIYDSKFSLADWVKKGSESWKQPQSGHIIAQYSKYRYLNSKYSFNTLGEYSLNLTPVIPFLTDSLLAVHPGYSNNKHVHSMSGKHTVMLYPDKIVVSGLQEDDIPIIMKLVMSDVSADLLELQKQLPSCVITTMPEIVVAVAANRSLTFDSVLRKAGWFHTALTSTNKIKLDEMSILVSNELGGHRNSTSVLILPSEDSFEFVTTEQKALHIIEKYVA